VRIVILYILLQVIIKRDVFLAEEKERIIIENVTIKKIERNY